MTPLAPSSFHRAWQGPGITTLLAAALLLPLAGGAHADDSQDRNAFRFGGERVIFHDSDSGFLGDLVPAGANLHTKTQDFSAILLSYARTLTPHVELELIGGIPPTYRARAKGPASLGSIPYAGSPLVSGKVASPAFSVNYHFNEPGSFYRPYLGAGLVYTRFYNISPTTQTDAINGGPTRVSFTDSLGLLVVAGVSFHLADHWSVQAGVTHADVRPTVHTQTAGLGRTDDVSLSPIVFSGALSYGF